MEIMLDLSLIGMDYWDYWITNWIFSKKCHLHCLLKLIDKWIYESQKIWTPFRLILILCRCWWKMRISFHPEWQLLRFTMRVNIWLSKYAMHIAQCHNIFHSLSLLCFNLSLFFFVFVADSAEKATIKVGRAWSWI